MKCMILSAIVIVLAIVMAGPGWASGDFMVYPAKGQGQDQMDRDKYECQRWATEQSGFDPMRTPTATTPPPSKEKQVGGAGRGAVGGGLLGAGVGALTGGRKGAGRGALIGAGSGALVGGMRRSDQQRREDQRRQQCEQEQVAQYVRGRNDFNRAYQVCLEGRGYTVR